MTIDLQIPDCELDEWLSELKPYQQNAIQQLLVAMPHEEVDKMQFPSRSINSLSVAMPPDEVAKKWIMASGSQNIIHFGGTRDSEPFWDRFKSEFKKFICDDDAYAGEKKTLLAEGPITKTLLISTISVAIAASIGYAATLLAPTVAVLLCTVGKIGINAYCNSG